MPIFKHLGITEYQTTLEQMKQFTQLRTDSTEDEIWFTEHYPVFTQGLNGKAEHILNAQQIPIVQTDRGGQVTYHGPGQLVVYFLINLVRLKIGVKQCVHKIENIIIQLLNSYQQVAYAKKDAPGVYINEAKIAALGLKIRKGSSYHGLSLNHDMDLTPFSQINPCGYAGLKVTQLKDIDIQLTQDELISKLKPLITKEFYG